MELFFDLVYVFAITQLSHLLTEHLDAARRAANGAALAGAVVGLGRHGLADQLVRSGPATGAGDADRHHGGHPDHGRRLARGVRRAGAPVCGRVCGDAGRPDRVRRRWDARAIRGSTATFSESSRGRRHPDCSGSPVVSRVGRRGPSSGSPRSRWTRSVPPSDSSPPVWVAPSTRDWNISGEHMAERCKLFLIIALGESILVTGGTFGQLDITPATLAAFVVAFLGSVALWWVYFDRQLRCGGAGVRLLERSRTAGPVCLHLPPHPDGGRDHRHRRRRRAGYRPPIRACHPGYRGHGAGRSGAVPGGTPAVQASGVRRVVDPSPGGDRGAGHRRGHWARLVAPGIGHRGVLIIAAVSWQDTRTTRRRLPEGADRGRATEA